MRGLGVVSGFFSHTSEIIVWAGITIDARRHTRRNSEFGTSGGFEFPGKSASVVYWNEWHKRLLRLRVR
jgi:hypothetical protein